MKITWVYILLFFITILSSEAQTINGLVLDKEDKMPLLYAHVYLESNPEVGALTDSMGRFSILSTSELAEENLIISFVGYENQSVNALSLSKKDTVYLGKDNTLPEVIVSSLKKEYRSVERKRRAYKSDGAFCHCDKENLQIASLITRPDFKNAYINQVAFFFAKRPKKPTYFRLRIYTFNPKTSEYKDILKRSLVYMYDHKGWAEINIESLKVYSPSESILFSYEWLNIEENYSAKDKTCHIGCLGLYKDKESLESSVYMKKEGKGWIHYPALGRSIRNNKVENIMLKVGYSPTK